MEASSISVKTRMIRQKLNYNGVVLLAYQIAFPEFSALRDQPCLPGINRFYRNQAFELRQYYEAVLFPMAIKQYQDDQKNGFPVRMFEAIQRYEVADLGTCVVSIYFDRYQFTGGAHGSTIRRSQTWNLRRCGRWKLMQLVHCPPDDQTYLLSEINTQIQKEPDFYFENAGELAAKTFCADSFYCTSEGIVIYYQQYDIAPYASGMPEFLIPYSACVLNPEQLCPNGKHPLRGL